jgi:hypothetical protein
MASNLPDFANFCRAGAIRSQFFGGDGPNPAMANSGGTSLRRSLATAVLAVFSFAPSASAVVQRRHHYHHHTVYRGRHHILKTVERVGLGAAGGAAIGAIAGGGPGAAIGAIVGGSAGAIYDHHEKTKGR